MAGRADGIRQRIEQRAVNRPLRIGRFPVNPSIQIVVGLSRRAFEIVFVALLEKVDRHFEIIPLGLGEIGSPECEVMDRRASIAAGQAGDQGGDGQWPRRGAARRPTRRRRSPPRFRSGRIHHERSKQSRKNHKRTCCRHECGIRPDRVAVT